MRQLALLSAVLLWVFGTAPRASAQDVEVVVEVSSLDVYVGDPFEIRILFENLKERNDYIIPVLPDVAGLQISQQPSSSYQSSTQFVNGQIAQQNVVQLTWYAVAQQAGEYTIPAFEVEAEGRAFRSDPITLRATVSETGDLLYVEIKAARSTYYVGETIDATLEVWLKPFDDDRLTGPFTGDQMWSLVSPQRSNFGPFPERPTEWRSGRRTDASGASTRYYVYPIRAAITAQGPGPLRLDELRIMVTYPETLVRERGLIGRDRLTIGSTRPIVGRLSEPAIEIRELPAEGRPPWFTGAVGAFDFEVSASPTDVAVGDPITLTMTISDRGARSAALDGLAAPALHRTSALTDHFRVPSDPIAGVVEDRQKVFTQSVRPLDDRVTEIPPIPFSYFDPVAEQYVTVRSDAMPIAVRAVAAMSMSEIVSGERPQSPAATELTEVAGGLLANYTGAPVLRAREPLRFRWWMWLIVVLPPAVFFTTSIWRHRTHRLRTDVSYARHRRAARRAFRRIEQAERGDASERARLVGAAVCDYVADRRNLPGGALTGAEVIDALRQASAGESVIEQVGALLDDCEQAAYAPVTSDGNGVAARGRACVAALEKERLR